jgi:putative transposase
MAGIVIPTASKKHRRAKTIATEINAPVNALRPYMDFRDRTRPQDGMSYARMSESGAWVQDFTYLWVERRWHYLAVVLDLATRQVLSWKLGTRHTKELTYEALKLALGEHSPPTILHSDQGSEYLSYKHQAICTEYGIQLSASSKASPWQNGYMERWFGSFKQEMRPGSYSDLMTLYEAIAQQIYYYNHQRIHTALGMSPVAYAKKLNLERQSVR